MGNIVLNTKTFGGRGIIAGVASYLEATAGVLAGFLTLTGSVKLPQAKLAKAKTEWRLRIPVVTEDASACACPGEAVDEIDCYIVVRASQGTSTAVRTNMALMVKDLTASPEFQASVISFTQPNG